ncbi:MAG: PilZ domain-containing protein [Deltaproteobacteria bacterium]|nr:PilZ domain-containing protein [Deltaproteobacteria bacterium]
MMLLGGKGRYKSVQDKKERRNENRYNANCQCWIEQESITLLGTVTNLSEKGFFLQTLPIIECGSKIDIRMNLQDVGEIFAEGKICWKSNGSSFTGSEDIKPVSKETPPRRDSNPPGMGIEFHKVTKGKEFLQKYFSGRTLIKSKKI